VFWGGREGYASLHNTDMKRELAHMARFLTMARDYGRSIGFNGNFLIEPKPMEPMYHQYDYDSATVVGFLREHGLDKDFKLNIEANHATLAGTRSSTTCRWLQMPACSAVSMPIVATRRTAGIPTSSPRPLRYCRRDEGSAAPGRLQPGGLNFDAKVRRESTDPQDLFLAHIGGMDAFARGLEVAHALLTASPLESWRSERYASFDAGEGKAFEQGQRTLLQLVATGSQAGEPQQRSGRQSLYENLLNQYLLR
jgi:xylose isomerase